MAPYDYAFERSVTALSVRASDGPVTAEVLAPG